MNFQIHRSPFGSCSALLTIETPRKSKFNILIDVGLCTEEQSDEYLRYIREIAPKADAVLLSSGLLNHCGALPYIHSHLKDSCRVYACLPSVKFGKTVCIDFLLDTNFCADEMGLESAEVPAVERRMNETEKVFASLYSKDDIDDAFSNKKVRIVSWAELIIISEDTTSLTTANSFYGISLQAFPAGYCISSTLWKITCLESGKSAVYVPKIGCVHGDFFCPPFRHGPIMQQCELLIMESQLFQKHRANEHVKTLPKPLSYEPGLTKESNQEFNCFLEKMIETVFIKKGTMFIPSDAGDQMVGILVLLNSMWKLKGFENRSIIVLSHSAKRFISMTKSLTNFASDAAQNDIFNGKENPFDFLQTGKIIPVENIDDFTHQMDINMPAVVIATPKSMQYGFSQELLIRFGQNSNNCILFDSPPTIGSVAHQLIEAPARNVFPTGESVFHRSSGPTHAVRNIHFYLRRRIGNPAHASSEISWNTPEIANLDPDRGAGRENVEGNQRASPSLQDSTTQTDNFHSPLGVYISRIAQQEMANPLEIKDISNFRSSFRSYGEPISRKLLMSWDIEQSVYFFAGSSSTQNQDTFQTHAGKKESMIKGPPAHPRVNADRYAFDSTSYKSYKISLKVNAEIYTMNLENRISLDDLKNLLRNTPDCLHQCCIIGKILPHFKNMIEKEEFLPKSKIWFTEKQMDSTSMGDLHPASATIARDVFDHGIKYNMNDPLWEIIILNGTLKRCKDSDVLMKNLLKEGKLASNVVHFDYSSDNLPNHAEETYFIGASSLRVISTTLESKSIKSVPMRDIILANDTCAIQTDCNTIQTEEMLCMDSLEVRDALCTHYTEI